MGSLLTWEVDRPYRKSVIKINSNLEVILKRFEEPDEITHFEKGKFETITLGGMTIGRATYQPGWKWSVDVGPSLSQDFCTVEHVGMVVSEQPCPMVK